MNYYTAVANAIHAAGLKHLIVENDTLLVGDDLAGWDVTPFSMRL